MKFKASELFDPNAGFREETEIREMIRTAKNYEGEDPANAQLLLIFSTSKQRTYLIATDKRLYNVLDDVRKPAPHLNWSMSKASLTDGHRVTLTITPESRTSDTGLVHLGTQHKNWLYSKALFHDTPIDTKVSQLVEKAMVKKGT